MVFVTIVDTDRHVLCVQFRLRDRRGGLAKDGRGGACLLERRWGIPWRLWCVRVRRGEVGLRGGYPGDIATAWDLTAMTGVTVPRDGFPQEISSAAVWAGEARIDAHGTYFGVVRHEGEYGRRGRSGVRKGKGKGKKKSMWGGWRSRRKRYGTGNERWLQRETGWSEHEAALERGHFRLTATACRRPRDRTRGRLQQLDGLSRHGCGR
jgi:hypothetical protein